MATDPRKAQKFSTVKVSVLLLHYLLINIFCLNSLALILCVVYHKFENIYYIVNEL